MSTKICPIEHEKAISILENLKSLKEIFYHNFSNEINDLKCKYNDKNVDLHQYVENTYPDYFSMYLEFIRSNNFKTIKLDFFVKNLLID